MDSGKMTMKPFLYQAPSLSKKINVSYRMRQNIEEAEREGKVVISQTVRLAQETKEIGRRTLDRMHEQTEQIKRTTMESDDTQRIAKENKRVMKDLNRHWVRRLFCMCFSKKEAAPANVKWHSDAETIKGMLKQKKSKYVKEQEKSRAAGEPSLSTSVPTPELADIPEEDFDTHIDRNLLVLESTVDDIKQIALEMRLQTETQTVLVGKMGESISKTKDMVKSNDKMMAQLAPALHKKHAQDEYLSTSDKLLLRGASASIKAKMSNL